MKFRQRYLQENDDLINGLFGAISHNAPDINHTSAIDLSHRDNLDDKSAGSLLKYITHHNTDLDGLKNAVAANSGNDINKIATLDNNSSNLLSSNISSDKNQPISIDNTLSQSDSSTGENSSEDQYNGNPMVDTGRPGENSPDYEKKDYIQDLLKKDEASDEDIEFAKKHFAEKMSDVNKFSENISDLYPSQFYSDTESAPDWLLKAAHEARVEKYGTDDPQKIVEILARQRGDLKYENVTDYLTQHEYLFTQLDQAKNQYNSSQPEVPFNNWLKDTDPQLANEYQEFNDEGQLLQDLDRRARNASKMTADIYKRLNNL
jgi:hypothetical protein